MNSPFQFVAVPAETRAQAIAAVCLITGDSAGCEQMAANDSVSDNGRVYRFNDGSRLDCATWATYNDLPAPPVP